MCNMAFSALVMRIVKSMTYFIKSNHVFITSIGTIIASISSIFALFFTYFNNKKIYATNDKILKDNEINRIANFYSLLDLKKEIEIEFLANQFIVSSEQEKLTNVLYAEKYEEKAVRFTLFFTSIGKIIPSEVIIDDMMLVVSEKEMSKKNSFINCSNKNPLYKPISYIGNTSNEVGISFICNLSKESLNNLIKEVEQQEKFNFEILLKIKNKFNIISTLKLRASIIKSDSEIKKQSGKIKYNLISIKNFMNVKEIKEDLNG